MLAPLFFFFRLDMFKPLFLFPVSFPGQWEKISSRHLFPTRFCLLVNPGGISSRPGADALGCWLLLLSGLVSCPLLTSLILLLCKIVPQHQWVSYDFNLATQLALVKKWGWEARRRPGEQAHRHTPCPELPWLCSVNGSRTLTMKKKRNK